MKAEENFFIQVLSDFIKKKQTELPFSIEWNKIYYLSRIHQVEGIIYHQCHTFMPSDVYSAFAQSFSTTLFYFTNRKAAMQEIARAFTIDEIPYCLVKGFEVAHFYPIPALRTMGDCDIVLQSTDLPRAIAKMTELGYRGKDSFATQQWGCDRNEMHFELHSCLIHYTEQVDYKQKVFFNGYEKYIIDNHLDWNFHFIFLLMHLRKHFLSSGAGFRQFMDLAVVIRYCKDLNWEWIEKQLKELKLERFAEVCLSLIEKWFGITVPIINHNGLDQKLYEQITGKILKNGVFGFDDPQNQNNGAKARLIVSKGPLLIVRLLILLKAVFLRYEVLRGYPGCSYLDGRPYLLPVAWVQRWFILLRRSDKSSIANTIQKCFISRRTLMENEKILFNMGLVQNTFSKQKLKKRGRHSK